MRTVTGPTDHVVVVGAGLAGLSAALRLASADRRVTLLERADTPGGRAGVLADGGYSFDTGPTVLTMPGLVADAFGSVGEDMTNWLQLRRLDPAYRAWFADGSSLDVRSDPAAMADEIRTVCGPDEAAGYERYVAFVSRLYREEMPRYIDRNIDSPADLMSAQLARLVALGGFRRMASKVNQYLRDPRTRRVFSFQAMYAGMSPFDALALYCVITYMDSVAGVWTPAGGMHAIPEAMAAAAQKHGVDIRYGTDVVHVERKGTRAVAVHTAAGERIAGDAFVLTPDLPVALRDLMGAEPRSIRRLRYSPSCFLMLVGSRARYSRLAQHNLHFGHAWRAVFDDLIDRRTLMSDPSFLVSNLTHADASLAPPGRHAYYVFFPTPNTTADTDWRTERARYRDHVLETLEARGYVGFSDAIEVEHVVDPAEWQRRGMAAGSPFAASHTFWQTGPFRPRNLRGENVVFAGSGTTPGVGVPMVLISGRLAAERIIGRDRSYRSPEQW